MQRTDYYPFGLEIDRNAPMQTPSARNNVNRFLYNGKEFQVGTGLLDYGVRMYMPEVGRWGGVDPLSEKMPAWSPYSYGFNNAIRFVDPSGMAPDDFVFNESGKFVRIDENDQPDKLVVENSKTGAKQNYDFADPLADPKDIRNGTITTLTFVSEKDIQAMMGGQGAFGSGKLNFGWESQGGGDFDYSFTILPKKYPDANFDDNTMKSNSLFLPSGDNTAHNLMNFGNYLWAATGYTVGFSYGGLQVGAHANSRP
ncbi:RHS repeat-associated core domain-containing protein [Dyadobacter pollutisoli]|uniref:RHS repeat-associated core domain-containing protein n=1 Tax=Dyadobacter pollutisoli TaxID=2910158 RepID=A0A9E8NES7_9BACT|nr:RHS repeat-associated core domain-containing protein [Dyadobacter pollutisoli]